MATGTIAIVGLAISAAAAAGSAYVSYKSGKEAKKQAKEEKSRAELEQRRARLKTIREGRVKRAESLNAGASQGTMGSSGLSGGLASVGSQVGTELGFSTQVGAINDNIFKSSMKQAKFQQMGSIFGGIGQIGGAMFSNSGAISGAFGSSAAPTHSPMPVPRPI